MLADSNSKLKIRPGSFSSQPRFPRFSRHTKEKFFSRPIDPNPTKGMGFPKSKLMQRVLFPWKRWKSPPTRNYCIRHDEHQNVWMNPLTPPPTAVDAHNPIYLRCNRWTNLYEIWQYKLYGIHIHDPSIQVAPCRL